jgi:hypothetical protein
MLEALKFSGINNTGHLISIEHSLHRRLDECDGDFPDDFAPDILSAKFFDPLGGNPSSKSTGIPQIFSLRWDRSRLKWQVPPVPDKLGSPSSTVLLVN